MSKKVCPECGHDKFRVTAVERHDWVVDGNGEFLEDGGCYEAELTDNEWTCLSCDAEFKSNAELVSDEADDEDFVIPDDDDDPKYAYERMTDLEIRYNGG